MLVGVTETTDNPAKLSTAALVRLVQGFYAIFWGLILTAMVAAHLLAGPRPHAFDTGLLTLGLVAVLIGSWRLWRVRLGVDDAGRQCAAWRDRTETLLGTAVVLAYFAVFFCAWRQVPHSEHLLANALAFLGAGVVYTVLLNRVVSALAPVLGRRDLAVESKWYGAGSIGFLLLPLVGVLLYAFGAAAANNTSAVYEILELLDRTNIVLVGVLLLPFSLTLSLIWATKDAMLEQLSGTKPAAR
jgi:hypothetical protein